MSEEKSEKRKQFDVAIKPLTDELLRRCQELGFPLLCVTLLETIKCENGEELCDMAMVADASKNPPSPQMHLAYSILSGDAVVQRMDKAAPNKLFGGPKPGEKVQA